MRRIPYVNERTQLLTVEELADQLRKSVAAIHTMRYRGDSPPAVRIGKRIYFPVGGVEAWIADHAEQRDERASA
jgi:predicted DNA-binding transcriptional regulator AlpA